MAKYELFKGIINNGKKEVLSHTVSSEMVKNLVVKNGQKMRL